MDVRTYRARSMQEALRMIREELGPDAAVLHTREVTAGLLGSMFGGRQIEVTASNEVHVPSRLPENAATTKSVNLKSVERTHDSALREEQKIGHSFQQRVREKVLLETSQEKSASKQLTPQTFPLYTDLLDAGFSESHARQLLETVLSQLHPHDAQDSLLVKTHLLRHIEQQLTIGGALRVTAGQCTVAALVGPTGVGKTTTIAKIAANFRLKEKYRVGLITVDTYRIAAVEQLRTYAEIIDLPMEVVSTPKEMRQAVQRFAELDLVLIDTAGRSPRDESQIQELRAMLAEAKPTEVHLVLSSVASLESQRRAIERFSAIGASKIILTKLDEAVGLGSMFPLLQSSNLPVSYMTHGQNVPHDIRIADRRALSREILAIEPA